MKRHVIVGVLALLLGMMFLLLVMKHSRGRGFATREASLVFVGFTNLPTGGGGVILCCTNGSGKPIHLAVENFDTLSFGEWETHRLDNGDGRGGLTEEGKRWLNRFSGTPDRLGPKEARTFFVPSPQTNTTWRIRFSCVEQTLGDKIRKLTIGGAELPPHAVSANGEWFTGRRYRLLSAEITR